jgi:F-type H+-transporting ATPase subunit delta
MSLRTSATRYAKALFDVAIQESDPVRLEQDLAGIVQAMSGNAELRRALTSPAVPRSSRVALIGAIATQAGAEPPVAKLLAMLADRGRLELLPLLLEVYRDRLLEHRNVVRASVTTAAPLSAEELQSLESRLGSMTGKHVQLTTTTDPALIGGMVARVGSTVYDGSIRTQLQKMKQRLVDNA